MRIINNEAKQIINVDLNEVLYFGIKKSFSNYYAIIVRPDKKDYYILAQHLSIEAAKLIYDGISNAFKKGEEEYEIKEPMKWEELMGRYMTQEEIDNKLPILEAGRLEFGHGERQEYRAKILKEGIQISQNWIEDYKRKITQLQSRGEVIEKLQRQNQAYMQNCNSIENKLKLQNFIKQNKPTDAKIKTENIPSLYVVCGIVDAEVKSTTIRSMLKRADEFLKNGKIYMVEKNNQEIKRLNNIELEAQLLNRIEHEENKINEAQKKLDLFSDYIDCKCELGIPLNAWVRHRLERENNGGIRKCR